AAGCPRAALRLGGRRGPGSAARAHAAVGGGGVGAPVVGRRPGVVPVARHGGTAAAAVERDQVRIWSLDQLVRDAHRENVRTPSMAAATRPPMDAAEVTAGLRWTLIATILGSSMTFIDGTVVNIALPTIGRDLHAGLAQQQ